MSRTLRVYVGATVLCGAAPIAWSMYGLFAGEIHMGWLVLASLTIASASIAIRVPSIQATLSLSEAFIFAATLLFGPAAGTLTAALDGLVVSLWSRNRRSDRLAFNVTEPALSVWIAATLFYMLSGVEPLLGRELHVGPLLPALLTMTGSYFVINTILAGIVVWLETRTHPRKFLRSHAQHLLLDFCIGISFAVIVVQNAAQAGLGAIFVILPLLLSSYLSSRSMVARLESAHDHLADLQRLYHSTVETLAMAVDAKDQVTHGHIRRVQVRCRSVASTMGATDEQLLRALDAAALLHDLGKLAVPEHILKKPGPLTPSEFEQVKLHASAGADILSGIDFPFPVVPVVRHHHENWDGTGYPDALAGNAIPLGARILAVVDCFDALTSDRPYRRKMSDTAALEIIRSRKGRMYDPAVVDAFEALHAQELAERQQPSAGGAITIVKRSSDSADSLVAVTTVKESPARAEDGRALEQLIGALADCPLDGIGSRVAEYVQQTMSGCVGLLYRYESRGDELVCDFSPDVLARSGARRFRLGSGITGWVGANRRTIVNSDARLDLGDDARRHSPPLEVCLSAPIVAGGELLGVLTIHSSNTLFDEVQRIHVEQLAEALVPVLVTIPALNIEADAEDYEAVAV